jgi:hypothetical protein
MINKVGGGPAAGVAAKIEAQFGSDARAEFEAMHEEIIFRSAPRPDPTSRASRYLGWEFERRLDALIAAYRERPRTKTRIEDDRVVLELYSQALRLKEKNPRMTWAQVATRIGVPYGTFKHWRKRLGKVSGEFETI